MSADGLVLTAPRAFEQRRFELPDVGEDDGVLRVEACGLCGTDHEQYTGHIRSRHAFIPGHEVIGVVEQVGSRAAERWGVEPGQRVAVEVFQSCRECDACRAGLYRRCRRNGMATMVGFGDADRAPGLWGGYATHLYLGPDSMLLPVPAELDPALATMFNPLGAGIRWAVDLPATQPGQVVAILGPGVRGLCAAAAVRDAGAAFVMLTGRGPRDADRLALAARFGVDLAVDITQDDPVAALKTATGGLADVVVDVTAMAPAAFAQSVALARHGGTVVVAGTRVAVGGARVPARPPRVQGAARARRPRCRRQRVPAGTRDAGRRPLPVRRAPREVVGFGGLEPLLQRMAGEGAGTPPVHAVFSPAGGS